MKPLSQTSSRVFLLLVPVLAIAAGFGIGKLHYSVYVPIWLINVILMVAACWTLGLYLIKTNNKNASLAKGAFFLIVPWILVTMFFGLGPPPDTAAGWAATATEQQVRYTMLTTAGIFIVFGFTLLREKLKQEGEHYYSLLGLIAIIIAIPLFILDMLFWGFTLTESYTIMTASGTAKLPEWFKPLRVLFGMISVVEVALTYLATIFFAIAMYRVNWLTKTGMSIYFGISLLAFILIILSAFLPEPFITAGFAVSIPAVPFLMPYFMGIHLLHKAGKTDP